MSLKIYSSAQMQQWDKYTIENEPIASVDLMERAATLAAKSILGRNAFDSAAIFCGTGNNGGDGLVIARLLAESGKDVQVYILRFAETSADFEANYKRLPKSIHLKELTEEDNQFESEADILVDAVFGSGLNRPVEGWIGTVLSAVNNMAAKKIAIDIPSGLFATNNTDNVGLSNTIKADETLTFMSPKMSFFYEDYHQYVGNFRIIDIELHQDFSAETMTHFVTGEDIHLRARGRFDHKGTSGCLSLIGGFDHMSGAAIIASKAAMKCGARYLFTFCGEAARPGLNSAIPEAIWKDPSSFNIPEKTMAIAIGPGLGTSEMATNILSICLTSGHPIILDADAINLVAESTTLQKALPANSILTPHLGELKKLIGNHDSPEKFLEAQIAFSINHQVFIIQKGPFSKLTTPDGEVFINSTGNPGMSTAGMGDALTGIIGAFLAQGYESKEAAIYGMFVHGYAADEKAKEHGEIGLLASDVIEILPNVINRYAR
jgi:hydroxyethylthiazole kinase-like uncharacterized protein yjeF